MAKAPKKPASQAAEGAVVDNGVKPVVAVNKVIYGKGLAAPSKSLFTPTTEKERDELFSLGAVREPTDAELVAAKMLAASEAPASADPSPAAELTGDDSQPAAGEGEGEAASGEAGGDAGGDENPLG